MDVKTHQEMVCMMENFVRKFNGFHLNKLLNIQEKGFKDIPIMNKHMDKKNEKCIMGYRNALWFFPGGNYNFRHGEGTQYPKDFVIRLCAKIRPGVKKIMDLGALPGGMGKKFNNDTT